MVTIRRIRTGDAAALRSTRLAALLDTPSAFARTHEEEAAYAPDAWELRVERCAEGDTDTTFFAEVDGEIVGLVGGHRLPGGTVELVSMWVAPAGRRGGVGQRLVEAVVQWADGDTVELWVTRGNDRAISFYERSGFVHTHDVQPLPSDPCKDELRMRRQTA